MLLAWNETVVNMGLTVLVVQCGLNIIDRSVGCWC
jgi:hypothetical protein